jgi:hypothetical protein
MAKKLAKAQAGKIVKANPYGKDFGAGLKNDAARKLYIKSDSLKKEGDRAITDAEWADRKNPGRYSKRRDSNREAAEKYKKAGDQVRKVQGYPTRDMELKKGGATKSKKK